MKIQRDAALKKKNFFVHIGYITRMDDGSICSGAMPLWCQLCYKNSLSPKWVYAAIWEGLETYPLFQLATWIEATNHPSVTPFRVVSLSSQIGTWQDEPKESSNMDVRVEPFMCKEWSGRYNPTIVCYMTIYEVHTDRCLVLYLQDFD